MTLEEINEIMDVIDADHTGVINYSEFLTATMNKKAAISDDKLKKAFNIYDQN